MGVQDGHVVLQHLGHVRRCAVPRPVGSEISFHTMPLKTVPKAVPKSSCRFTLLPDPLSVLPVRLMPLIKCGRSLTVVQTLLASKEVV